MTVHDREVRIGKFRELLLCGECFCVDNLRGWLCSLYGPVAYTIPTSDLAADFERLRLSDDLETDGGSGLRVG